MKHIILLISLSVICTSMYSQEKATMGMSQSDVEKLYPGIKISGFYQNTVTLERSDTIYGIPENWGYRFENGKLNWIYFHKYIDEITESNFKKCLEATEKVIADYTKYYGKPDAIITGNRTFRDPYTDHHWGYDVIEARWSNYNGMKIKVEFTFMGGKGEYNLLIKIHYFEKSYPYYD
jgi:hypothetical protein